MDLSHQLILYTVGVALGAGFLGGFVAVCLLPWIEGIYYRLLSPARSELRPLSFSEHAPEVSASRALKIDF